MQKVFVLLLSLVMVKISSAQDKIYFDKFFRSVSEKPTRYVRSFTYTDSLIYVTDMINDTISLKGSISPVFFRRLANDFTTFIRSNGSTSNANDAFVSMKGDIDLYTSGKPARKLVSHSGKVYHAQVWSNRGETQLTNGSGKYTCNNSDGSTLIEIYRDSMMQESYEVRHLAGDTIYNTFDEMAEPRGGHQAFVKELGEILRYPGFARLAGKQGVVYVQFIVDKEGKLTEFRPLTKEGFNMEKKVVDKLSRMPAWKPGTVHGKPVKMKFVLPVKLNLT